MNDNNAQEAANRGLLSFPKVSVVVPIYNCEPYITQCIQSLANQTMADFQAVCVDDGSTDGSLRKARKAAGEDERFVFLALSDNKGQSAARNVALDHALGEYIVLLDADDYLVSHALEHLVDRADKQKLDDLYFSGRSFYEGTASFRLVHEDYSARPDFEGVATGKELFSFFEEHDGFFPQAPLRMVRRSLVEDNGIRFFEGIIHEDLLFTLQTLLESQRSSFLNEELYMRRIHMGSTMVQPKRSIANVHGHFICMRELQRWLDIHIESLDRRFIAAIAHRAAAYRAMTARDWYTDISQEDRDEYLDNLENEDLLLFLQTIVDPGFYVQELYDSKTYRFGDALLSVPRTVRDKAVSMLKYHKEK